jgi:hypothetical protein
MNQKEIDNVLRSSKTIAKSFEKLIPELEKKVKEMSKEEALKFHEGLKDVNMNSHVNELNIALASLSEKINKLK